VLRLQPMSVLASWTAGSGIEAGTPDALRCGLGTVGAPPYGTLTADCRHPLKATCVLDRLYVGPQARCDLTTPTAQLHHAQ
jgi:hypothetical protein